MIQTVLLSMECHSITILVICCSQQHHFQNSTSTTLVTMIPNMTKLHATMINHKVSSCDHMIKKRRHVTTLNATSLTLVPHICATKHQTCTFTHDSRHLKQFKLKVRHIYSISLLSHLPSSRIMKNKITVCVLILSRQNTSCAGWSTDTRM